MKRLGFVFAVVLVGLLTAGVGQTASAGVAPVSSDHYKLSPQASFDFVNGSPTITFDDLFYCTLLPRAKATGDVTLMLSGAAKLEAMTRWLLIPLQRKIDKTEYASIGVASDLQESARG